MAGGTRGVALAAVCEDLLKQLPILPGWMGASAPFDFEAKSVSFASDARRFTQSTMPYVSIVGLQFLSNSCYPSGKTELKHMHVNWPRCWLMALENTAGNRFMTFMAWRHLLTSSRSHTAKKAHGNRGETPRPEDYMFGARPADPSIGSEYPLAPYNDAGDVTKLFQALAWFHSP